MKKNDVALLVGVILIKVATGMAMGLFGPMLPSLANSTRHGMIFRSTDHLLSNEKKSDEISRFSVLRPVSNWT